MTDRRMDGWTDARDGQTDGRTHAWKGRTGARDGRTDKCTDGHMHGCMDG